MLGSKTVDTHVSSSCTAFKVISGQHLTILRLSGRVRKTFEGIDAACRQPNLPAFSLINSVELVHSRCLNFCYLLVWLFAGEQIEI